MNLDNYVYLFFEINVSKIVSGDKVLHKVRKDYAKIKQLMINP